MLFLLRGRRNRTRIAQFGMELTDRDFMAADRGDHPSHGELFERGWSAASVVRTSTRGALAGEEIVNWFAAQLPPG